MPERLVIGWKEYVAFPAWGVRRLRAKVDSGARSSALGVAGYEQWHDADRGAMVRFRLGLSRKYPDRLIVVEAPIVRMVMVCNTGGTRELRPLIEAEIEIGPVRKPIRLTLTSRAGLRFRMILGRQALEGDFVVDVSEKYLLGREQ